MAPLTVPIAHALPRRLTLPEEAMPPGSPPLEFLRWPLYSFGALDGATTIPRELELFNYTVGQTVSGAGGGAVAATRFHTNMMQSRALPQPKVFTAFSMHVVVLPLDFGTAATPALSDPSTGAAVANDDQVDDLTLIYESCSIRFDIGEKNYVRAPLKLAPANYGLQGLAAASISQTNAAAIHNRRVAVHSCGIGWDFNREPARPPVLWPLQTFNCKLLCQWATNPSLVDDRLVGVLFWGVLGREIQ